MIQLPVHLPNCTLTSLPLSLQTCCCRKWGVMERHRLSTDITGFKSLLCLSMPMDPIFSLSELLFLNWQDSFWSSAASTKKCVVLIEVSGIIPRRPAAAAATTTELINKWTMAGSTYLLNQETSYLLSIFLVHLRENGSEISEVLLTLPATNNH